MNNLKNSDTNRRKGGCLRYGATTFCVFGVFVYLSKAIFPDDEVDPSIRPIFIGSAVLMAFFIWLMWRPRKVSNQSNDSESSDNLMPENNTATISPSRFYIGDLFKAKENASLKERITQLESLMSPEQRELQSIKDEISTAKQELTNKQIESDKLDQTLHELQEHIASSKAELIETDEAVMLQSFGLYEPIYDFSTVDAYKDRLADIRKSQKAMIKAGTAATGSTSWSLNGNKADGERMVKDMQKLLIRAFNSECDEAISKVKFNTFETAQKRITTSRDAISKLGRLMGISIKNNYYMLKIEELRLALEFQIKKQEEKEEQKRIREELREQAKLQKEIEEARRNIKRTKTLRKCAIANTQTDRICR